MGFPGLLPASGRLPVIALAPTASSLAPSTQAPRQNHGNLLSCCFQGRIMNAYALVGIVAKSTIGCGLYGSQQTDHLPCSEGLVATPATPKRAPYSQSRRKNHSVFAARTAPQALSAGPRRRCRGSRSALGWALQSAGRPSATTHRGRGLVTFALQRVPAEFNLLI